MINAFGAAAREYAGRLGDIEAIVTDLASIGNAYGEAVRRRELGQSFYGMVCFDDPRVIFGYRYTAPILTQVPDYDVRLQVMDFLCDGSLPINTTRADAQWPLSATLKTLAVEFMWLCNAILVRSFTEFATIQEWNQFGKPIVRPQRSVERILAESRVPTVSRVRPDQPGVVVWAPNRPSAECALHLHGLAEFHGELTCVSAGGPPPPYARAVFVSPTDPQVEAVLARATALVCVEPNDPSDAVAFARQGYGVVAPWTSGAHEFADDVVAWDALNARALFPSVAIAVAQPAGVRGEPLRPPHAPQPAPRAPYVPPAEMPLVTIITPTYNRPDELRLMLGSLAAQTYPNIESIVVNDGGTPVADVVADFPFARLIDKPQNEGTARAQLTGWQHARGEYIGLLPDDDWLFPQHVALMVEAMQRSGAKIAHGAGLLRYRERREGEAWVTVGFNATTFCQTTPPSDTLISSNVGGHQMLVHRSVYEDVGWYLLDNVVSDNEIHIRFAEKYPYVYVDQVTTEFRDHVGSQGRKADFPAAMREIYHDLHPAPNRPWIATIREKTLESVTQREAGKSVFPPTLVVNR